MTDSPFDHVRDPFGPTGDDTLEHSKAATPIRSVTFVCTGNICRSAYAHALLQWMIPDLKVVSAGIYAMRGHGVEENMAAELAKRGVPADGHHAEQISEKHLKSDLILTMSETHRQYILEEHPEMRRRVGMLGNISELADIVGSDRIVNSAHVAQWAGLRAPASAEVVDPYRKGAHAATVAAQHLDTVVEILADLIAPADESPLIDDDTETPSL